MICNYFKTLYTQYYILGVYFNRYNTAAYQIFTSYYMTGTSTYIIRLSSIKTWGTYSRYKIIRFSLYSSTTELYISAF
jgi:hypothetical protein